MSSSPRRNGRYVGVMVLCEKEGGEGPRYTDSCLALLLEFFEIFLPNFHVCPPLSVPLEKGLLTMPWLSLFPAGLHNKTPKRTRYALLSPPKSSSLYVDDLAGNKRQQRPRQMCLTFSPHSQRFRNLDSNTLCAPALFLPLKKDLPTTPCPFRFLFELPKWWVEQIMSSSPHQNPKPPR